MPKSAYMKKPIVIVGAGPAGSTAAYYLANRDVLIVDKKSFPRHKPCGGGLLNSRDWGLYFGNFSAIQPNLHTHPVFGMTMYWDTKPVFAREGHLFDHVRRVEFDDLLLQAALKKSNVSFRQFSVSSVTLRGNEVIVSNGKDEIAASCVIGCDGWNSQVARCLGNPSLKKNQFGSCMEHDIACDPTSRAHVFFCFRQELGYAWVFPASTGCYVGLGFVGNYVKPLRTYLDDFLDYCIGQGIVPKSASIRNTFGAPDPIFIPQTYSHDNALLAGDAMGLVKQISGEGIFFAMLSAKIS